MSPSKRRNFLVASLCVLFVVATYVVSLRAPSITNALDGGIIPHAKPSTPREYTKTVVVASTQKENTDWVLKELPSFNHAIYVADDDKAPLHPPKNKGTESMMYLSYIIDHYHNLSDTTIFVHSGRNSWHNNDLQDFDLARMVSQVSNEHVERVGYFNLRCHHESGCPDHIKPHDTGHSDIQEQKYFAEVWGDLHGPDGPPMPDTLAVACCSQFAASRAAIQKVPLERWVHYRHWILKTYLPDAISGRLWEWTWHYILTGQAVVCPPIEYCYCDGFGLCFRDEGEITSWLAMKEVQILAGHMRDALREKGKAHEVDDVQFHLDQRIGRPLHKWLYEAEVRGRDPYTRALLSGRASSWVDGDGY